MAFHHDNAELYSKDHRSWLGNNSIQSFIQIMCYLIKTHYINLVRCTHPNEIVLKMHEKSNLYILYLKTEKKGSLHQNMKFANHYKKITDKNSC